MHKNQGCSTERNAPCCSPCHACGDILVLRRNLLHDGERQLCCLVEVALMDVLILCVAVLHADAEDGGGDPVGVEVVGIRAAALLLEDEGISEPLCCAAQVLDGQGIGREFVGIVVLFEGELCGAAAALKSGMDGGDETLRDGIEFCLVAAACLEVQRTELSDDVGHRAPRDRSDVAGGLCVDAPLRDGSEHSARCHDGVASRIGIDAGVCCLAADAHSDLVLARRLESCRACVTVRVEGVAEVGVQERAIYAARAVDAALLRDGEDDLQVAVGDVMFPQTLQGLEDGGDARLVICAEDGRAVGADDAVRENGLDICARLDAVHVRREHDGRYPCDCTFESCDDIARAAAECPARFVLVNLCRTERAQTCCQQIGDLTLVERGAADGDESEEIVQDAFLVNHDVPPSKEEDDHKGDGGEEHRQRVAFRQLHRADLGKSCADECRTRDGGHGASDRARHLRE